MSYCEEQLADIFGIAGDPRATPPPDYYANLAECYYRRNEDAEAVRVLPTLLAHDITGTQRLHSVIGSQEEVAAGSLTYAAVFMHVATSAHHIGDEMAARRAIRKSYALLVEAEMHDREAAEIASAYLEIDAAGIAERVRKAAMPLPPVSSETTIAWSKSSLAYQGTQRDTVAKYGPPVSTTQAITEAGVIERWRYVGYELTFLAGTLVAIDSE